MNVQSSCIRGPLLIAFTFFLIFAAGVFAVAITIDSPNASTNVPVPDLNLTTNVTANITYNWNGEGNISGCRQCNVSNTTYGENNGSDASLVALWHFNENFGNITYDDSVNKYNLTFGNATAGTQPTWTTGKFGSALSFDGINDFVANSTNTSNYPSLEFGAGNFSISLWIKTSMSPTKNKPIVMERESYLSAKKGYHISIAKDTGTIVAGISNGTIATATTVTGGTAINDSIWHHIVAVFDRSADLELYVDGSSDATPGNISLANGNINAGDPFEIGANTNKGRYFDGMIDEIAMFNRTLSSSEVSELYNKTLSEGQHNVTVYANDSAGNSNSTTRNFTFDTTPPNVTINSPANLTNISSSSGFLNVTVVDNIDTNAGAVQFIFENDTSQYNGSGVENEWTAIPLWSTISGQDDANAGYYNITLNVLGLAGGNYIIKISANDSVGNSNNSESVNIAIDNTPPNVTITSPVPFANLTSSSNLLNVTIVDNVETNSGSVQFIFENGTSRYSASGAENVWTPIDLWTAISDPQDANAGYYNITFSVEDGLADGKYAILVSANDTLNNTNSSEFVNITIDNTLPAITIASPQAQDYTTTTIDLNVSANETMDTWTYSLNNATNVTFSPNTTITATEGENTLEVYANDSAGNMNYSNVSFTVDTGLPNVIIDSPANQTIADNTPVLSFTVDEPVNIAYSWDNEGNISGCRNCTSFNTTYGENNGSDQNLALLLHFNENFSNTTYDETSNGNDGTLGNATLGTQPVWIRKGFGYALDFDGNNDFVSVSDSQSLDLNGSFTLTAWIYYRGPGEQEIISKIDRSTGEWVGYHLDLFNVSENRYVGCMSHNTTGPENHGNIGSDDPLTAKTWYFVACVRDTSAGKMELYVDGEEAANSTTDNSLNKDITNSGPLYIGSHGDGTGRFNGTIDEVAIYDRALSGAEIQQMYNRAVSGGLSDGLHYVTVYANDTTGNLNSTTRYFTVDTTPPTITTESPQNRTHGIPSIDYNITVNEPLNWANVSIDGGANLTMDNDSWDHYFNMNSWHPDLTDGTHNATFYVQDISGWNASKTVYFTVNASFPEIEIQSPAEGETYGSGDIDFNVSVTNVNMTGGWVTVNGTNYTLTNSSVSKWYNTTVPTLPEGYYNATFYGNSSGLINERNVSFTVDTSPPYKIVLNYPQNNSNVSSSITFSWTSYDNVSTQLWSNLTISDSVNVTNIDTNNGTLKTSQVSGLSDGIYNWNVTTWDQANNPNTSVTHHFTVDTKPPTYSDVNRDSVETGASTLFSTYWQDGVGLSGYVFSWNNSGTWENASFADMTGTEDWSNVTKTLNSTVGIDIGWRIYANDSSGNWNDTGVQVLTTEDTSAPVITIISPEADYAFSSGTTIVTINLSIVESNPDRLVLNWEGVNTPPSTYTVPNESITKAVSDGNTYTFYVWANDTSGNSGQTETRTFSVRSSSGSTPSSGGGGPAPTPAVTATKGTVVITFSSIDVASPATFEVPETDDVYLTRVLLAVKNRVLNVKLTVNTLAARPAAIEKDVAGIIYKYVDVVHENVNDEDVSIAILTFKVAKSWIDDNDIDPDSVTLNRYSEGSWAALTTTKLSCDSSYCYHEAGSPGLSVFGISGSIVKYASTTQTPTTTLLTATSTVAGPTSSSLMTPAPIDRPLAKILPIGEGSPLNKTAIALVIILIILIAAYMYYRHRKKDRTWWDDRIKSIEDKTEWAILKERPKE